MAVNFPDLCESVEVGGNGRSQRLCGCCPDEGRGMVAPHWLVK